MKIDINEKEKVVALWFSNKENPQKNLPSDIEKEIETYRQKNIKFVYTNQEMMI